MYWLRLAGFVTASLYLAAFLWTLKKRSSEYFLGRRGKLKFFSAFLGMLLGLLLAWRPPLAAPLFLIWVLNGAVQSWLDYFYNKQRTRARR